MTDDMGWGGTGRQIITLDKYLNKDIFEHFIISFSSVKDVWSKFAEKQNVFYISDPKEIAGFLRKNNISLVYAHRHGKNEPAYDRIAEAIGGGIGILEMNTFSVLDPGSYGVKCDKRIFISKTNVVKYCKHSNVKFDFKKHKVVYALVNTNNFISKSPTDQDLEEYKNQLGITGCPVIGRIARPVIEKWDDEMLIMWKKLSKINPKVKFLIYGVPESKKKLLESAGLKENLIMFEQTDSDKKLGLFYSAIDILIHDSQIGECFGGTTVEAMLFKKPAIVMSTPFPRHALGRVNTRDNGLVEQIKNGENGYVVKNGSAMAYAVADLLLKPELIKKMGQNNYDDVKNRYDVSIGIKTLEKTFIETILDKNAVLSEGILNYYNSLAFFPNENEIRNWFSGYYLSLENVYGKEYRNNVYENAMIFYLRGKRKARTLLKRLGLLN